MKFLGATSSNTADIITKSYVDAVTPSQTGNSGKYLTTDGSVTSWGTVAGGSSFPIALGTAAAPSMNFTSDTDTGVYSAGANLVDVAAGGYRVAEFLSTGTAVNYLEFGAVATGSQPSSIARGTDTNIGHLYGTKGFASHSFQTFVGATAYQQCVIGMDATPTGAQNYFQFSSVNPGSYPYFNAAGGDANIGLDFYPKGTAPIRIQGDLQVVKSLKVQGVQQTSRVADTAAINTTATYVTQAFAIPANTLIAGDTFEFFIHGTCTSTAANISTFTLRMGTAGTTADTSLLSFTTTAATTGTSVPFVINGIVTVRTIGAPGTATAFVSITNNGVTGVSNAATVVAGAGVTANITTTGLLYLGLTYSSAAATTTCTFRNALFHKIL